MGEKIRVVLDTNVWVSIIFDKRLSSDFEPLIESGKIEVFVSEGILEELARVLTYPNIRTVLRKAGITPETALKGVTDKSFVVTPTKRIMRVREDPSDNAFLEVAAASHAKFIVSGDKHLLKLKRFGKIQIYSLREFLDTAMN